jgi:hypothetical protein
VFTSGHRDAVRRQLLELAEQDPRITGAALTGSAADGREDRWSDIDLFFGVADAVALDAVVSDWSGYLYGELGALHHFDVKVPAAAYRAFLLPSCLAVDLGFTAGELEDTLVRSLELEVDHPTRRRAPARSGSGAVTSSALR